MHLNFMIKSSFFDKSIFEREAAFINNLRGYSNMDNIIMSICKRYTINEANILKCQLDLTSQWGVFLVISVHALDMCAQFLTCQ